VASRRHRYEIADRANRAALATFLRGPVPPRGASSATPPPSTWSPPIRGRQYVLPVTAIAAQLHQATATQPSCSATTTWSPCSTSSGTCCTTAWSSRRPLRRLQHRVGLRRSPFQIMEHWCWTPACSSASPATRDRGADPRRPGEAAGCRTRPARGPAHPAPGSPSACSTLASRPRREKGLFAITRETTEVAASPTMRAHFFPAGFVGHLFGYDALLRLPVARVFGDVCTNSRSNAEGITSPVVREYRRKGWSGRDGGTPPTCCATSSGESQPEASPPPGHRLSRAGPIGSANRPRGGHGTLVRRSVAGAFYPADAARLRDEVAALLAAASSPAGGPAPAALIVPTPVCLLGVGGATPTPCWPAPVPTCAGWFMFGPSHFAPIDGLALPGAPGPGHSSGGGAGGYGGGGTSLLPSGVRGSPRAARPGALSAGSAAPFPPDGADRTGGAPCSAASARRRRLPRWSRSSWARRAHWSRLLGPLPLPAVRRARRRDEPRQPPSRASTPDG